MDELIMSMDRGKIIKQGLKVVLSGKPNVGKSSLLNALLEEERAIVTNIPGTTRDTLEECVLIRGAPIVLIDTAGLGQTLDPVEAIGIERARQAIQKADLVLYILEVNGSLNQETLEEIHKLDRDKIILVINKTDLEMELEWEQMYNSMASKWSHLWVSARTRSGLDVLTKCLLDRFLAGTRNENSPVCLINARHGAALSKARDALINAMNALDSGIPSDMIAIDFRHAWNYLGEITGDTADEDLIERIFSKFCLGK
jgi:tRNA modification GTPase